MKYRGSCHCGAVAFEVEGEIDAAVACNCSICARKGALLWAAPRASLRLKTPESAMASYTFNKQAILHRFCRTCGLHPFAEDAEETEGHSVYVNLRCLDDFDLAAVQVIDFDGRAL